MFDEAVRRFRLIKCKNVNVNVQIASFKSEVIILKPFKSMFNTKLKKKSQNKKAIKQCSLRNEKTSVFLPFDDIPMLRREGIMPFIQLTHS